MRKIELTDLEYSAIMHALSQRIEILERETETLRRKHDEYPQLSFARDKIQADIHLREGLIEDAKQVFNKLKTKPKSN